MQCSTVTNALIWRCDSSNRKKVPYCAMHTRNPARLENTTIKPIPPGERHGTAADLFTVWFGSNFMLLTIVTGGLAVTVFALPFGWALAGLAVGNLVGAMFMALHL